MTTKEIALRVQIQIYSNRRLCGCIVYALQSLLAGSVFLYLQRIMQFIKKLCFILARLVKKKKVYFYDMSKKTDSDVFLVNSFIIYIEFVSQKQDI